MSITSPPFGCKKLCAAKPLFRQGKSKGTGACLRGDRIAASAGLHPKQSLADQPKPASGAGGQRRSGDLQRPAEGFRPPPHSRSVPGYGRDPVGNGHAAAGFSAVLAPEPIAADGILTLAVIAVLALGLTGLLAAFFFFLAFFFAAFFFLPVTLLDAFFLDDFFLPDAFFFFFLPPFFAFFFAISISLEVVAKESPATLARTIQTPGEDRRAH